MLLKNTWKLIELPKITDERGSLTFIEGNFRHLPFDIKRIYYLYDVPKYQQRGSHGHKELQQLMIAISGQFDITLDNGIVQQTFNLNSPSQGL